MAIHSFPFLSSSAVTNKFLKKKKRKEKKEKKKKKVVDRCNAMFKPVLNNARQSLMIYQMSLKSTDLTGLQNLILTLLILLSIDLGLLK